MSTDSPGGLTIYLEVHLSIGFLNLVLHVFLCVRFHAAVMVIVGTRIIRIVDRVLCLVQRVVNASVHRTNLVELTPLIFLQFVFLQALLE